MTIKSPYYQQEQAKNPQLTLQMKYPKFALPNSLVILKKYKKQQAAGSSTVSNDIGGAAPSGANDQGATSGPTNGLAPSGKTASQ